MGFQWAQMGPGLGTWEGLTRSGAAVEAGRWENGDGR